MRCTIAICHAPLPDDYREAAGEVERLAEQPEPVRAAFDRLVDRLTARYPCICDLPDDDDSGPWCSGPLRQKQYTRATVFGLVYARVDEVLPFVLATATALGFTVLDWQTGQVHRPASCAARADRTRPRQHVCFSRFNVSPAAPADTLDRPGSRGGVRRGRLHAS